VLFPEGLPGRADIYQHLGVTLLETGAGFFHRHGARPSSSASGSRSHRRQRDPRSVHYQESMPERCRA